VLPVQTVALVALPRSALTPRYSVVVEEGAGRLLLSQPAGAAVEEPEARALRHWVHQQALEVYLEEPSKGIWVGQAPLGPQPPLHLIALRWAEAAVVATLTLLLARGVVRLFLALVAAAVVAVVQQALF